MKRLYVLIDQKLDAVYGCVQGGHAVAQWLLEHPNQEWNNSYLIYLYADLDKWKVRLDLVNKDYSSFYEPDLDSPITSVVEEQILNLYGVGSSPTWGTCGGGSLLGS